MIASNKIERWSFRRLFDPCTLCGADEHANRPRAFDSRVDLLNGAGRQAGMPDIVLPVGPAERPTEPLWRASTCEAVDRITVYLVTTPTVRRTTVIPAQMLLEIRLGIDFQEEPLILLLADPQSYEAGGHLVTFATSQLFESVVITGTTIGTPGVTAEQSVSLRLFLDRAGMFPPINPLFGALANPVPP